MVHFRNENEIVVQTPQTYTMSDAFYVNLESKTLSDLCMRSTPCLTEAN